MSKAHFGLVGLGVMGENLVLNAERNGFSSVVYNRTYSKTEEFLKGRGSGKNISGAKDINEFVGKINSFIFNIFFGQSISDLHCGTKIISKDGEVRYNFGMITTEDGI